MFNRKVLVIFTIAILSSIVGISQSANILIDSNRLKDQATKMAESFMKADYETFVKLHLSKSCTDDGRKSKNDSFFKTEEQCKWRMKGMLSNPFKLALLPKS
jgi:hypothetical protein